MKVTYSVLAASWDDNFFAGCEDGCSSRERLLEGVFGVGGDLGRGIICPSDGDCEVETEGCGGDCRVKRGCAAREGLGRTGSTAGGGGGGGGSGGAISGGVKIKEIVGVEALDSEGGLDSDGCAGDNARSSYGA